jgi:hypothetical protein
VVEFKEAVKINIKLENEGGRSEEMRFLRNNNTKNFLLVALKRKVVWDTSLVF